MEFRLLGPLEVLRDGRPVALGGAKPRALLGLLLLHANEVVSRDRLIDELWGDRVPGTAGHSLDVQISRLRKAFAPDELLLTGGGGYVLQIEPEDVDAHRFQRLVEEGRRANSDARPEDALVALEAALALWRGAALADLAYESFVRTEIERLEELRLVAIEERIDAQLALGHHDTVIPELEAAVSKHPLRERLRGQLMLALYRAGRQPEALRVYGDARKRLLEELGLEPSQALRELEQSILRQDPVLDVPPAERAATRRHRMFVGVGALVLASAVAASIVLLAQGGSESAQALVDHDSNVLLNGKTGTITAQTAVRDTVHVAFGEDSVWSVSADGEVTRLDPASGHVVATVGTGVTPGGLAVGEGAVWVTDRDSPTLIRIDPTANEVVDRFLLPTRGLGTPFSGDVVVGAGSVWVGHGGFNPGAFVEQLEPETGRLEHRFPILAGDADRLAFADGLLWVGSTPSGELRRIDPNTNSVTKLFAVRPEICCVAAGDGYAWVATNPDHLVLKIDTLGRIAQSFKLAGAVRGIAYEEGALWAAVGEEGTVVRIDGTTNATRSYEVGHNVTDVDVRGGLVAVAVQESGADVAASVTGDGVWVGRKASTLFDSGAPTEPAWTGPTWDVPQVQFHYATCARLLNYRDAEGDAGRKLIPEVAASLPEVSGGGRTYTFEIREGFRFSPPSNEEVTAESFRRAVERAMSPKLDPNPKATLAPALANIIGAEAYHAGTAGHLAGISIRDNKLVIRLRKPAPGLPWLAALSCAVPLDTPVVPGGIETPVAAAGPYYLQAHSESVAVLRRNPNYGGTRPQHLDAIVYRFGVAPEDAAAQIEAGTLDYFLESQNPTLTSDTAAARAAGKRYRMTADGSAATRYLAFNLNRPLFADIRMRRAVQYALDRTAIARIEYGVPATRLYSPKSLGFDAKPLYPVQPDLRTARRLSGGRKARAVLLAFDPKSDPVAAESIRAIRGQLAAIGITVSVLPLTNDDFANGGAGYSAKAVRSDLTWGGINAETGDPVDYLRRLVLPQKEWNEINQIARLTSPRREQAAAALARRLERKSLFAVYAYAAIPELVSRRLGCVVHQPEYPGVDLAALCLREKS